jgi:hypothetical protein
VVPTGANIECTLAESYAAVANHLLVLFGIDASAKLRNHGKRVKPQRWLPESTEHVDGEAQQDFTDRLREQQHTVIGTSSQYSYFQGPISIKCYEDELKLWAISRIPPGC